jgi:hypothetical protein
MRRALRIALPMLFASLAGGCWIFVDEEDCLWSGECGGESAWCSDGSWGDDGSGSAWGGGGGSGVVGAVCVPGSTRYCDTPTYCSWGEQRCNDDGAGWSSCYEASPPPGCGGYAYDQDCCMEAGACCQDWYDADLDGDWTDSVGACEEPSPCPDGGCGCASDSECGEGLLCIASLCVQPDEVCFFDFECGEAAACLDNECHARCEGACPAGQACLAGLCLEPAAGPDGCVYDEDCGCPGLVCVNATCLAACESDAGCGEREVCSAGACRPDPAPVRQCAADSDCGTDLRCLRGVCRLPCAADLNCGGAMSLCGADGLCLHPAESAPECTRASDCEEGLSCLGNACLSL